jgi:hypothetical protein
MFKMIIGVLVVTVVLLITMAVVDRVTGDIVNPSSASLSTSVVTPCKSPSRAR